MEKDSDKYNVEEEQDTVAEMKPEPVVAQVQLPPYVQQPYAPAPAPAPVEAKRKSKHTGLIVGIIAAVLILVIAGVVLILTLGGTRDVVKSDVDALLRGPQLSYPDLEILRARRGLENIFRQMPFYGEESTSQGVSLGLRVVDFPDDPEVGFMSEALKTLSFEVRGGLDHSDAETPRAAFDFIIKSETTGESVPVSLQIIEDRIFLIVEDLLDKPLELPADALELSMGSFELPGDATNIPGIPFQSGGMGDLSKMLKGSPVPVEDMEPLLTDLVAAFFEGANVDKAAKSRLKTEKNVTMFVGEKKKVELKVDAYEMVYYADMIRDGFVRVLETVGGNDAYRQILLALYESQPQFTYPIGGDGNGALFLRPGESLRSEESFGIYVRDLIDNLKENGLGADADILLTRRIYAIGNHVYGTELEVAHPQRGTRKFRFLQPEKDGRGALEISLTNDSELNIVDKPFAITADYDIKNGLATGTLYLKYLSGKDGDAPVGEIRFKDAGTVPYKQRLATVGKFTLEGKMLAGTDGFGNIGGRVMSSSDIGGSGGLSEVGWVEIELAVRGDDCVFNVTFIGPESINPEKMSFEITYRELSGEQANIAPIDISLAVKPEELTPQEVGILLIKLGGIAQKLGLESLLGILFSGGLLR